MIDEYCLFSFCCALSNELIWNNTYNKLNFNFDLKFLNLLVSYINFNLSEFPIYQVIDWLKLLLQLRRYVAAVCGRVVCKLDGGLRLSCLTFWFGGRSRWPTCIRLGGRRVDGRFQDGVVGRWGDIFDRTSFSVWILRSNNQAFDP